VEVANKAVPVAILKADTLLVLNVKVKATAAGVSVAVVKSIVMGITESLPSFTQSVELFIVIPTPAEALADLGLPINKKAAKIIKNPAVMVNFKDNLLFIPYFLF